MMICKILFVIVIVFGNLVHNYDASTPLLYTVPEPKIQAFNPRGLKVSIPDYPGIHLFAFHGNINIQMDGLNAGQMSKDILNKQENEWVFWDPYIKLKTGDKIYYWLFVIKDGLGYRYDNGFYEVKEIQQLNQTNDENSIDEMKAIATSISKDEKRCNSTSKDKLIILSCERLLLNLTETLVGLQSQVDSLRETNEILKDIIEKQPSNITNSLTMIVRGGSLYDDPTTMVEEVIRRKLNLPIKVVHAGEVQADGSVKFQVRTLNEKISIIKAANEKLKGLRSYFIYY